MRFLLDTHIFIWSLLEPERLSGPVRNVLEDVRNQLFLSAISVWETLILAEKGRIQLYAGPYEWIRMALQKAPIRQIPVDCEIAIHSRLMDLPHNDPADRFLAATAVVYDLILITADQRLIQALGSRVLSNH